MALPITAIYAGLLGLGLIYLSVRVIALRRGRQVALGDGGDADLLRAIRAHGNAVETVPLALILLGLSEGLGSPAWLIHLAGATLVVGRALHATHFRGADPGFRRRVAGMALTFAVIGTLSAGLIAHGIAGL